MLYVNDMLQNLYWVNITLWCMWFTVKSLVRKPRICVVFSLIISFSGVLHMRYEQSDNLCGRWKCIWLISLWLVVVWSLGGWVGLFGCHWWAYTFAFGVHQFYRGRDKWQLQFVCFTHWHSQSFSWWQLQVFTEKGVFRVSTDFCSFLQHCLFIQSLQGLRLSYSINFLKFY